MLGAPTVARSNGSLFSVWRGIVAKNSHCLIDNVALASVSLSDVSIFSKREQAMSLESTKTVATKATIIDAGDLQHAYAFPEGAVKAVFCEAAAAATGLLSLGGSRPQQLYCHLLSVFCRSGVSQLNQLERREWMKTLLAGLHDLTAISKSRLADSAHAPWHLAVVDLMLHL